MTNWDDKPVDVTALPGRHCGNYEVLYFERWNGERGAYRCVKCGLRFRLREAKR